jgi:ribosomal protein L32
LCRRGGSCFSGWRRRRFGFRSIHRKNDLANFNFVAFFDSNFLYGAAHRGRHFDNSLIRFQLHDGLAGAHRGSRRNHEANEIALFDVFSQLGKFEFNHFVCSSCESRFLPFTTQRLKARPIMLPFGMLESMPCYEP